jgi:hypothetical protein
MELHGTFAPPAMGNTSVPIPLVGPGRFALTEAGLSVSGFRRSSMGGGLIALAIVGGIFATAFLVVALEVPKWATYLIIGVIVTVVLNVIQRGRGRQGSKSAPWAFTVPWASVTDVSEDPQMAGAVVVRVKKFSPSGTIHFQPPEGTSLLELMAELRRRAGRR